MIQLLGDCIYDHVCEISSLETTKDTGRCTEGLNPHLSPERRKRPPRPVSDNPDMLGGTSQRVS
jgi:hypothetical protein